MSEEEHLAVLGELAALEHSDAAYGRPVNWLKARRLAIFAPCCQGREPLVQVMNTSPPSVVTGQVKYTPKAIADQDEKRRAWQGATQARGERGVVLFSHFEQMVPTEMSQHVWCRHRRWAVPVSMIATARGRHVLPLEDNRGKTR